ncbi:MAG: DUF599 family protein [Caulobacteraceae bacterium]|nr:DUF599 family protein [Caulobacteraceae bacterium]
MQPLDIAAIALFMLAWLGYAPVLRGRLHAGHKLNSNMAVIRAAWMHNMSRRANRFLDSQLLGHVISSASFFASSNLILIAALTGALVGGARTWNSLHSLPLVAHTEPLLLEFKLALVIAALARSLLDFIWSIRQMNYCLAAIGAAPENPSPEQARAFGLAAADVINPALSSFSAGVRGYYFALAAGAWVLGPIPFMIVTVGATGLLIWRQIASPAAGAVKRLRALVEAEEG